MSKPTEDFKKSLVLPHKKKSREVTNEDLPTVMQDAHIMFNLCHTQIGPIPGSYAIHHSQVNDKDPLSFFVTAHKEVIINPVIVRHTKVPVNRPEGCVSFPFNHPIIVERFHKVEVECSVLQHDGSISPRFIKKLTGVDAQVYQHEIQHGQGSYIYNIKDRLLS